ncbi:MAG: MBL fold metallo-hydrolase [Planctomycetota bacterium]|jgi:phosphoribosyl 1,2-cyclic phosphodiesterase
MRVVSLQSGSNGNCYFVEGGGVCLVVDAGISGKRARQRAAEVGVDIADAEAVLISHDHSDHSRGAGVFHRMFDLPICATAGTMAGAQRRVSFGQIDETDIFRPGQTLTFGDLRVETVVTPHDGIEPVSFVFDDGRRRLGILTDLGHVFDGLGDLIASLDAVIVESNYDPHMLATGPYPTFLKRRITGDGGHISNVESAELLDEAADGMDWVCLGHLSGQNNNPQLALATHRKITGNAMPLHLAGRDGVGKMLTV